MTEGGRLQDAGRSHKRRRKPSAADQRLLTEWHATLRAELRGIVDALAARQAGGLLPDADELMVPLEDPRRDRLIDRGVKVARELGGAIDESDAPDPEQPKSAPPRRRRVDYGGA